MSQPQWQMLLLWLALTSSSWHPASGVEIPLGPKKTIYDDLLTYLFANESAPYKANSMPICEVGQKLQVQQDMVLLQLFDLDEPIQLLTVDVWVESTWKDCRLTWDPKAFNNVDNFAVKAEEIWYPDLIFYESLHGNFEEGMFIYGESTARIFSDGSVQLGAQAVFKSFCRISIAQFPFDSQSCNITFSSWTKDTSNFVLTRKAEADPGGGSDHAFESAGNGEWQVLGFPSEDRIAERTIGLDEAGGRSRQYSEVRFQLKLKRKYLFQQTYMIFPCMLLTWLTLFVFVLPTECGEKMAYVTTILLSLVVFLLLVSENIPRSGDAVPVLGVYFCMAIGLVSLANVKTVISYNISLKGKEFCVPAWLQQLLRRGKYVGLPLTHHSQSIKIISFTMKPRQAGQNPVTRPEDGEDPALMRDPNDHGAQDENQWRFLGIIFDRAFLVIYFVLNLIASIWILCQAN